MERMGETKKRKETEDGKDNSKPKKSRRSGADTVEFLREKSEQDFMFKQQELESKKQQQEAESARHEAALKRQDGLIQLLIEQQQQQTANLQTIMAQQSQMFMTFMTQVLKK